MVSMLQNVLVHQCFPIIDAIVGQFPHFDQGPSKVAKIMAKKFDYLGPRSCELPSCHLPGKAAFTLANCCRKTDCNCDSGLGFLG